MKAWIPALTVAAILSSPAARADSFSTLGERLAAPQMQDVTDGTLAAYFGPTLHVSETHAGDCGATVRITSDVIRLRSALLALRRVADCSVPKPVLALRLTVDQLGAPAMIASMRGGLGKPCFEGPGAQRARSVVWVSSARIVGVVQDSPPSVAFSVFWVNHVTSGSSDPQSEQMVRRLLEADLPHACVQTPANPQ